MAETNQIERSETLKNEKPPVGPDDIHKVEGQAQQIVHDTVDFLTTAEKMAGVEKLPDITETDAGQSSGTTVESKEKESNADDPYGSVGIWLYGIDRCDPNYPTAKEKIWTTLERMDQRNTAEQTSDTSSSNESFTSLMNPDQKGEQVRTGDLIATYDALTLRINTLKQKNHSPETQRAFERQRDSLTKYLSTLEGVDLSEDASNSRLQAFRDRMQSHMRGCTPAQTSANYRQVALRAASLEVYGGADAQADLAQVTETLNEYPHDPEAFRMAMVREELWGDSPHTNEDLEGTNETVVERTFESEMSDYEHYDLISQEIAQARKDVAALGVSHILSIMLTGSAARKELRPRSIDAEDPSDIDLLVVISDEDMATLADARNDNALRINRSRTAAGATFYIIKRPSVSGELADTEIMITSRDGFEAQLNGTDTDSETKFVTDTVSSGLFVE